MGAKQRYCLNYFASEEKEGSEKEETAVMGRYETDDREREERERETKKREERKKERWKKRQNEQESERRKKIEQERAKRRRGYWNRSIY
tara:strand:- start:430 stop:696 length:267 start_codon:yes stop_codon:yes gene_type:complete